MSHFHSGYRTLEQFSSLIPGIDKVICIQVSQGGIKLNGSLLEKGNDEYSIKTIGVESVMDFVRSIISSGIPYQWYAKEEIPFKIISKQKVQLTIFNELKNSVLSLLYKIDDEDKHLLYFIYFNENLSNFLLEKINEPFSSQHKTIAGFLIHHSVRTVLGIYRSQEMVSFEVKSRIEELIKERDALRDHEHHLRSKEKVNLLTIAQHYLDTICRSRHFHAVLSDSAKSKLLTFKGNLFLLEKTIQDAIDFATTLSPAAPDAVIMLADYHIHFPEIVQQELPQQVVAEGLSERYQKTHLLLDRLEHAANGLKERRVQLTSANVGRECQTPISAPAITDALKKHKKRILDLFERYPDKWMIIRHEFRPVQNLLNMANTNEALTA
ncbi:MAG: hypothetical protein JXA23_12670 [Bacteroidales bacterium]|nr:hypothetical protein [Bacteroidales bacterium]